MKVFYIFFLLNVIGSFVAKAQNDYLQSTLLGYGQESGCSLYIDDAGNAYAIINSRYDINFSGQLFLRHGASDYSVIGKFNSSGQMLWARTISKDTEATNNSTDIIYDLKIDANQNVYVSGAGGGIILDDGTVLSSGTFLIKFDGEGNTLWGVISKNTQNMSSTIGGPISLANDGVYWSSTFYGKLELQDYVLMATVANNGAPNAFVAKVNGAGKVTSIYHHPSVASIPQILVASDDGNATVVINTGGTQKRIILDENCNPLAEKPFLYYGDFPSLLRKYNNGYEMLTNLYGRDAASGSTYPLGFYDFKFDRNLNITDSTQLVNDTNNRFIYDAINNNDNGYYLYLQSKAMSYAYDWILLDKNLNQTTLKPEEKDLAGQDVFTKNFVKMSGDTLNMMMRHLDYFTNKFTFNRQSYTVSSNVDASYFWVKYKYKDPDSCKRVKVEVVKNGKEGLNDVLVNFKLPSTCPASENIIIDITLEKPETNDNDFTLPATITINKGTTEAVLRIPVIDDYYMENTENFTINLAVRPTETGYIVPQNATFTIEDDDNIPANKFFTITYPPQIAEGDTTASITVSLAKHVRLKEGLRFTFTKDNTAHQATPGADYNSLSLFIPPDTNQVTFNLKANADYLIEGDEFISGKLVADTNTFGPFISVNNLLKINIIDIDNTEANRVFNIVIPADSVLEGNKVVASLQLPAPYRIQDPLAINVTPLDWFPFLQQSTDQLYIDSLSTKKLLTITYPDDHIIRTDKKIALLFSNPENYVGRFKFKQNSSLISDTLKLMAIDDDLSKAYLQLYPLNLKIKEGFYDYVNLKLPDDYVMESLSSIKYIWSGLGISEDKRIGQIFNAAVLPALENSLALPIQILNDNVINTYNLRQINFSVLNSDFKNVQFSGTDTVNVEIIDDEIGILNIPNTFTPNGDGINDTWKIGGLTDGAIVDINIWDRNGSSIYKRNQYRPWDGIYNGHPAPIGTYYYTISSFGKILASGNVTIIR